MVVHGSMRLIRVAQRQAAMIMSILCPLVMRWTAPPPAPRCQIAVDIEERRRSGCVQMLWGERRGYCIIVAITNDGDAPCHKLSTLANQVGLQSSRRECVHLTHLGHAIDKRVDAGASFSGRAKSVGLDHPMRPVRSRRTASGFLPNCLLKALANASELL